MKELVRSILSDTRAGLQQDASGRRYFRQRKVRFQTIEFNARGMLEGDWLQFQGELESPFRSSRDPAPSRIREFAISSSERFLTFYYKVFDVAVARALATLDQNFFQVPFIRASTYLDLGIPENIHESSVHPSLHRTILDQYHESRNRSGGSYRVHFLSEYLVGLTDDAIELLRPYRELWQKEARIEQIHERLRLFKVELARALFPEGLELFAKNTAGALHSQLSAMRLSDLLQKISDPATRKAVRPFLESQQKEAFAILCRDSIILSLLDSGLSSDIARLQLPEQMDRTVRSAFLHETRWHSRWMRFLFLQYRQSPAAPPAEELRALDHMRESSRQAALQILVAAQTSSRAEVFGEMRQHVEEHARLREEIREIHRQFLIGEYRHGSQSESADAARDREAMEQSIPAEDLDVFRRARSVYGDFLRWPQNIAYGNPFARREVLTDIKEQLIARLRPVRSATTGYSLIPGSRHGILPLNPVMKLWKEKAGYERQLPEAANKEINLKETVFCLLDLARLVHPELDSMELRLGRIVKEKLGIRNLKNMHFFLMPGSCGVVREIERPDFPDFRNIIIGESRKPQELGITEPSILTGAWYKKRNHSLYYPVGGDNGQLLRSIYLALRLPGPAAFYFALGQFVHDCLDDSLIYYFGSEIPFRQVMEDYYLQEDRVRKNRGEKTGRRKIDNSRDAVRFMFAVAYSRFLMEALTGSSQTHFRHPPTERWMLRYLNLPVLSLTDRSRFREIRKKARSIIEEWSQAMQTAAGDTHT